MRVLECSDHETIFQRNVSEVLSLENNMRMWVTTAQYERVDISEGITEICKKNVYRSNMWKNIQSLAIRNILTSC